ncbi:unnamed protein product [Aphanomyces euteiches]|uniref:F-box domain-containing protein n=1 Tax=Aphanomyces euteiches TaxID=100861 RepID=A0A6G0WVA6_9STRA|nr:hypothetical protein Ae201684_011312 [Aphanomyces euteiches]KAH9100776.1 hypothetical protein Ae201684P_006970 [Aphanomyces euteiches]KAH9148269.1 hypothetical protein AeRB84_008330 [Aphanomyces euteiches]
MKKAKTSKVPSLPLDIVVKVVFYIGEWYNVVAFLEALRPRKMLGPLEHLWQLHLMAWKAPDLWPLLDLTDSGQAFKVHLEGIVKLYSKVLVNLTTDVAWFRQIALPTVAVHWTCTHLRSKSRPFVDLNTINQWKNFQIVSIDKEAVNPKLVFETLSCLEYLSEISWQFSEHEMAVALFQYAASSSSLRKLDLESVATCIFFSSSVTTTMSTSMANDLLTWVVSQPVQFISMKGYMWENNDLRQQIVTSALEKPTLERFVMEEINASKWKILGKFNRRKKLALLEFSGPRDGGYEGLDLDKLRGFIKGFRPILVDDIETLYILGIKYVGHCNIWPTLAPLLKQSKVKILIMECGKMEGSEANEVAEVLCHLPALQKLESAV